MQSTSKPTAAAAISHLPLHALARGCHPLEHDAVGNFRWTCGTFQLPTPAAPRLRLTLRYLGQSGALNFSQGGRVLAHCELVHGWQDCCVELDERPSGPITVTVGPLEPAPAILANWAFACGA